MAEQKNEPWEVSYTITPSARPVLSVKNSQGFAQQHICAECEHVVGAAIGAGHKIYRDEEKLADQLYKALVKMYGRLAPHLKDEHADAATALAAYKESRRHG